MSPRQQAALVLAILSVVCPGWADTKQENQQPGKTAEDSFNKKVVAFCQSHLKKKVGGGECAHLVIEALRTSGAEFALSKIKDNPNPGDYVWGDLIKSISWNGSRVVDSNPRASCLPGDVIQYRDGLFSSRVRARHHTSIIAAVNSNGEPTLIYEQNARNVRSVMKNRVNFRLLTAGWVRIYRPSKPTIDPAQPVEFTLLNKTKKPITYHIFRTALSIGEYDTERSFMTIRCGRASIALDGRKYPVAHRKAYEFFSEADGTVGWREVE
jgi:hypothetical protein